MNMEPPNGDGRDFPHPYSKKTLTIPNTDWEMIIQAQKGPDSHHTRAIAAICQNYWYPFYAYARGRGNSKHEAEDLTQEYFSKFLDSDLLSKVDREKGKLRSILYCDFKYFLQSKSARARAAKRGGSTKSIPIDLAIAEQQYAAEMVEDLTPDQVFDLTWAAQILRETNDSLSKLYAKKNRHQEFELLRSCVIDQPPYAPISKQLGISVAAAKARVFRFRKEFRKRVTAEIQSVVGKDHVQAELSYFFEVLALTDPDSMENP